ncbi:MAG: iron-containing alcohol dehydrogenase, partial [Oscillospiraceae bacterium]|nr:iron-containing alcohol dehydrogenase [Oscillospiraceae bacterium]
MQQFTFHSPSDVWFGRGAETHIAEYVKKYGKRRVLIVTGGSSVKRSGAFDRVCDILRTDGIDFAELSGVKANPILSKAREGIALAEEFRPDLILGFGGGSVIDTAKM